MYPGYLRAVKKIIAKEYEKELRACTKKYGVSIDQLDELLEEGQSELENVFNSNLLEQEEVLTQALNVDLDSVELR